MDAVVRRSRIGRAGTRDKVTGIISLVGMFFVNASGFFDHATHSGQGCGADWPLCHGAVVPALNQTAVLVEYGHRVITLVFVVSLIVFLWTMLRNRRDVAKWAGAEIVLLIVEGMICTLGVVGPVPHWVLASLSPIGLAAQAVLLGLVWLAWPTPHFVSAKPTTTVSGWLSWVGGSLLAVYLYAGGFFSYASPTANSAWGVVVGAILAVTLGGWIWQLATSRRRVWMPWSLLVWVAAPWLVTHFAQPNWLAQLAMMLWLSWGTGAFVVSLVDR